MLILAFWGNTATTHYLLRYFSIFSLLWKMPLCLRLEFPILSCVYCRLFVSFKLDWKLAAAGDACCWLVEFWENTKYFWQNWKLYALRLISEFPYSYPTPWIALENKIVWCQLRFWNEKNRLALLDG